MDFTFFYDSRIRSIAELQNIANNYKYNINLRSINKLTVLFKSKQHFNIH